MTMRQRLQPYLKHLPYILLAVVLGVVDLALVLGASGALGQPPDPAALQAKVNQAQARITAVEKQVAEQKFPATAEVENLVLSLSQVANKMNVRISAFASSREAERLADRNYVVIENTLELRGQASDLIAFLGHIQQSTGVDTLEIKSVNLRSELGSWIFGVQVRMLTE